jgi:hypothetical protein
MGRIGRKENGGFGSAVSAKRTLVCSAQDDAHNGNTSPEGRQHEIRVLFSTFHTAFQLLIGV